MFETNRVWRITASGIPDLPAGVNFIGLPRANIFKTFKKSAFSLPVREQFFFSFFLPCYTKVMTPVRLTALFLLFISISLWFVFAAGPTLEPSERPISIFIWAIILAAFFAGLFSGAKERTIAIALALPPLILAIWTAPRGDDDGLWILIFPFLLFSGALCYCLARLGANIRKRRLAK